MNVWILNLAIHIFWAHLMLYGIFFYVILSQIKDKLLFRWKLIQKHGLKMYSFPCNLNLFLRNWIRYFFHLVSLILILRKFSMIIAKHCFNLIGSSFCTFELPYAHVQISHSLGQNLCQLFQLFHGSNELS